MTAQNADIPHPQTPPGRGVPVIDLSLAPGEREAWGGSKLRVYTWAIIELLFVTNSWQISSRLRVAVLRLFGAKIGNDVIFRPGTKVKFPWKLQIGDNTWIGEGVWIHNQSDVHIGGNVVISQDAFITTGSHSVRTNMGLVTKSVTIMDGAWITSRCVLLGGCSIGKSAIITPNSVVSAGVSVPEGSVFGIGRGTILGQRFKDGPSVPLS